MAVPTLAFLAGSPPAAIELASVPWIRAQPHPQSDWPTGRPHLFTRANRGPSSSSEPAARSAPTSPSQNPRRNPHSPCCTAATHSPRFRALALFGRRPLERVDSLVIAGIRKPAQDRTNQSETVADLG